MAKAVTKKSKKKKILIAEDEKPMAEALVLKLNKAGFEAKAVNNGKEAVAQIETGQFDLLLLDLMMPVQDGWGVLTELVAKKIKIPVIITSNLSQEEDVVRAKKMVRYMMQPLVFLQY